MGRIRSKIHNSPKRVNGVQLGEPIVTLADGGPAGPGANIADCFWAWDHELLPDGELHADGSVTMDKKDKP